MDKLEEIKRLVESNAKAIEILSKDIKEMYRERNLLNNLMTSLCAIEQPSYHQIMKNLDDRRKQLDNQQKELAEILKAVKR